MNWNHGHPTSQCPGRDTSDLQRLIDSRVSQLEERELSEHIETCEYCRRELEELAAPKTVWDEAVATFHGSPLTTDVHARRELEGQGWVLGLLSPSEDMDSLGVLDGREVRGIVGQGGMGIVVSVWDSKLNRALAIKMLSPILAGLGAARQRFFREAQAAAGVIHPNIIPIYDIQADATIPYIVMPLVGGGNLQEKIDRDGPLPTIELLSISLQIAEALQVAHAQGLIHRDIKPANILLDDNGRRVFLSDFGLARALDDASLTASGMLAGTPAYMSPEQAQGLKVNERSDLYSLGAVMYAMATGYPPAQGETSLEVLRRVSENTPRPIQELNEQQPAWLQFLVDRLLCKDCSSRVADATAAAELIRQCLAHSRSPAHLALPPELQIRKASPKLITFSLAATFLVLFLVEGLAGLLSSREDLAKSDKSELQITSPSTPPQTQTNSSDQTDAILPNDFFGDALSRRLEAVQTKLDALHTLHPFPLSRDEAIQP